MSEVTQVILIDQDAKRRSSIFHYLTDHDIHVEPLESLDELNGRMPSQGLMLVHDDEDRIASITKFMADEAIWFPIVAFSAEPSPEQIVSAILDGALNYTNWPLKDEDLTDTLEIAQKRAASVGKVKQREAVSRQRIERLSPRERQVLGGITDGLTNREIGEKLSISPRTVEIHRTNMLNKLGASGTSEAVRTAIEASFESSTLH